MIETVQILAKQRKIQIVLIARWRQYLHAISRDNWDLLHFLLRISSAGSGGAHHSFAHIYRISYMNDERNFHIKLSVDSSVMA